MKDANSDIIPRNLHFNISKNAQRHWLGGDPLQTAVVDCFSIFLPEGERYFIRALKHFAKNIDDPYVREQIRDYASQEAFHTREHEDYNRALREFGYDVDRMENSVRKSLDIVKGPKLRIAMTCAIEHLTATFSILILRDGILDDGADAYRRLWTWHALEELEHEAVALNVLHAVTKDMPGWQRYFLRVSAMNAVAISVIYLLFSNVVTYARRDGIKINLRFWARVLWITLGQPGYTRRSAGSFLRYYLPGFGTNTKLSEPLIAKARDWLDREIRMTEGTTITVG